MLIDILLLIIGFILLIKGADVFIDGSSSIASNFKVPKILIGLSIIAFGTSAPEFAISMNALRNGSTDILLGNVIGSCIMNILLILGIAAVINPIKIKDNTIKIEIPMCLMISTILVVLFLDIKLASAINNQITRSDAFIIIIFFLIFIYYLFNIAKEKKDNKLEEPKFKLYKSILLFIIGLIGIIYGSNLVVNNASSIAHKIGISERVISLSIIAFGTSLPELITTIISSKKKEQDLLIGNIIGSNIFNICIVLAIPVAIYGTITPDSFQFIDLIMLIGSNFILYIFALTHKVITRLEGILLLLTFIFYYLFVFII